jgi:hypothetical protein
MSYLSLVLLLFLFIGGGVASSQLSRNQNSEEARIVRVRQTPKPTKISTPSPGSSTQPTPSPAPTGTPVADPKPQQEPKAVPTPALLPGLLGLGASLLRRKHMQGNQS